MSKTFINLAAWYVLRSTLLLRSLNTWKEAELQNDVCPNQLHVGLSQEKIQEREEKKQLFLADQVDCQNKSA